MCLSAVKLDHSGELFWDTPSWSSAWVSVFWAWRMDLNKGVPTLFAYCKKLIWKFVFKFKQGTCPWMAFAWIFFPDSSDFFFFLGGSVGQIIYREYIVFRGSNISCSLACSEFMIHSSCHGCVKTNRDVTYMSWLPVPFHFHVSFCRAFQKWCSVRGQNAK